MALFEVQSVDPSSGVETWTQVSARTVADAKAQVAGTGMVVGAARLKSMDDAAAAVSSVGVPAERPEASGVEKRPRGLDRETMGDAFADGYFKAEHRQLQRLGVLLLSGLGCVVVVVIIVAIVIGVGGGSDNRAMSNRYVSQPSEAAELQKKIEKEEHDIAVQKQRDGQR